ncbi:hypothetical protein [Dyella mobilis]|uniref:hypothetical protein n=1 Tax=Dyella mobilis TaxID=1849582 RepID=UPI00195A5A0E|nr:hypothetical protein [Dyella mobilis]GLQ98779.1 hypothetical protein GCM10007863_31990 [Dyella mobilis]
MIQLLVNDSNASADATSQTAFGGLPSAGEGGLHWPICKTCHGHMQFLGQLRSGEALGDRLLLLFECQNRPGLCDDWDADGGGNAVMVVATESPQLVQAPPVGETTRPIRHGASVVRVEAGNYDQARQQWASQAGKAARDVLGQLGGEPSWIQGDETPSCNTCGERMAFVAQLEEGPEARSAMNFGGGGCAYLFQCGGCETSAKMLWQC